MKQDNRVAKIWRERQRDRELKIKMYKSAERVRGTLGRHG
jgi:hypothetical protein